MVHLLRYKTKTMNRNSYPVGAIDTNRNWRSLPYDVNLNVNNTISSTNSQEHIPRMLSNFIAGSVRLYIPLYIFAIVCCIVFLCVKTRRQRNAVTNEGDNDVSSEEEGTPSLASKILKMSTEERIDLYSKAFDKTKHQVVLDASSIIVSKGDGNSNVTSDSEEESREFTSQDDDPSIYLALQEIRSARRSTILGSSPIKLGLDLASGDESTTMSSNDFSTKKASRRRSSLIHPRCSITDVENLLSETQSTSMTTEERHIVRGNCVICFEDMQAGERVVWSESKSCPHVYHKDCMVAYLAHKKQTKEEIEQDENPCPMCRQKFVTVCTLAK